MQKEAYRVTEFCECYGVPYSRALKEIRVKRLKALKLGRQILITRSDAQCWLKKLDKRKSPKKANLVKWWQELIARKKVKAPDDQNEMYPIFY